MKEMAPLCGASEEINVCRIPYKPVILDKSRRRWHAFLAPEVCFHMGIWKLSSSILFNISIVIGPILKGWSVTVLMWKTMTAWLAGWLADLLNIWLAHWLASWLPDQLGSWLTIYFSWGETKSTWYWSHCLAYCTTPDDRWRRWWWWWWLWSNRCPSATLSTTNPTWSDPD
jgi:hypothetical protein